MSSKYDWWKCARCGGRFLINESMHGCYQGKTMDAENYGDALDATLGRIEELEREKRELYGRFVTGGNHWTIFNGAGAVVADNMPLEVVHDYLTTERFARGWHAAYCLVVHTEDDLAEVSGDISERQMQDQEQPD